MRTIAYALLAVLAVSAMATAQEESGIYGVVRALSPDGLYGDAVSNAVVNAVDGEGRTVARSVTGPNGAYRLVVSPGSYRLISQHPAYASFDTGSTVLLVQDGHFTLFNIGLEPKAAGIGSITGHVLSESGEPAVGAVIVVRGQDGEEVARVDTGPEGSFAIELVPGNYLLSAEHPLLGASDSIDLSVEERETAEVELSLASPAEALGGFQGLVRVQAEGGAAGRPIAGAQVTATGEGGFSQDGDYQRDRLLQAQPACRQLQAHRYPRRLRIGDERGGTADCRGRDGSRLERSAALARSASGGANLPQPVPLPGWLVLRREPHNLPQRAQPRSADA